MTQERCPRCGADQTDKAWFVGKPKEEGGTYEAVCWNCRAKEVEPPYPDHRHVGTHGTEHATVKR